MESKIELSGFKELDALLRQLPERIEKKVLQKSIDAGAREVRKQARRAAPVGDPLDQSPSSKKYGPLRKNIRVIRLKRVSRGQKMARVDTGKAFWGYIIEMGSRYIPANPWFSQAFNAAAPAAVNAIRDSMLANIEKEALKLAGETGANKKR